MNPKHPANGNSSQERNLPCALVEEIIVAPPTMQQHMGSAIMLIVLLAAVRDTVFALTEMRVIRVW